MYVCSFCGWLAVRACAADATVTYLSNTQGPADGGTLIVVHGTQFVDSPNLYCRFGTLSTRATFMSTSTMNCTAPPHVAGAISVEITNNNLDYTTFGVTFQYLGS